GLVRAIPGLRVGAGNDGADSHRE
ncbi:peptidase M41, partial [Pseudomonas sp. GW456-11-11-14-LB2]